MPDLRCTWATVRKMHITAVVENKHNPSVVACDISIVFGGAHSRYSRLTCLRVIVWSGVCCASLILALDYMSVCSLLTLCLTTSGSYVDRACLKNTFHTNLLDPLVETLALMNHDLSENESLFAQNSSIWKDCVQFFQSWHVIQCSTGKSFLCSLDNCPLFWLCGGANV